MIEKKEFEASLLLITNKGKKIRFFTREKWEVKGKNEIGVVSPKRLQFKKDGKSYQVWVGVSIGKTYFFRYRVGSFDFKFPPDADYQIYYSNESKLEPKRGETSKPDNYVILVDEGRKGDIVLLVSFLLVIAIIVFIFCIVRRRKKKKFK